MGVYDFNSMYEQAQAEGFSGTLLPVDTYVAEVASTNSGTTQKGADKIGVRFKVIEGPHAGGSVWLNINFPDGSNPKAFPPFFRKLAAVGVDQAFLSTNPSVEQIEAKIGSLQGSLRIKVTHRDWNGTTQADVTVIGPATPSGPPAPPAPPAAAPAAPQAAPVTAAPAAEAPAPAAPAATPDGSPLPARRW